jgi:maleate isomerase
MINKLPRKRIGLLVPSSNTVMEVDFYRNLPEHITVHTARMYMESTTAEGESRMLDEFTMPAVHDLATARPDVIVFGCTSAGALRGNDYDDELCKKISSVTGVPVVSVIRSAREVIQENNIKKVVVVTPYVTELNDRIQLSLETDGLEVMKIAGLGIFENFTIAEVAKEKILELAKNTVGTLNPDGLFVSCTNFPAMNALKELRDTFPFPVITSNQAAFEKTLKKINDFI